MTNPLIPYSFIPGTKAKASEVNANFTAVADAITSNKQYTIDEIESLDTKIQNNIEEVENKIPKKDLSDTNYFTNCILEAPNGVAEYSGNTITVKKGLKVIIPDGRNDDGSLKNIEITLEEDKSISFEKTLTSFISINSKCEISYTTTTTTSFMVSETAPNYQTTMFWYQPSANVFKYTNDKGANWTVRNIAIIGKFSATNGNIASLKTDSLPEFIKDTDTDKLKILNWITPDWSKAVSISGATGTFTDYGYLYLYSTLQSGQVGQLYINGQIVYKERIVNAAEETSSFIIISKGDTYTINGIVGIIFFPMKGVN